MFDTWGLKWLTEESKDKVLNRIPRLVDTKQNRLLDSFTMYLQFEIDNDCNLNTEQQIEMAKDILSYLPNAVCNLETIKVGYFNDCIHFRQFVDCTTEELNKHWSEMLEHQRLDVIAYYLGIY